jgi:hypothetical protein
MRAPSTLQYTVQKEGYLPAEGVLKASIAPGRVVGAVFTLGIVAMARSIFYYPEDSIITVDPAQNPMVGLTPLTRPGTGHIEGQAFAKTLGGELRYAAGNTIAIRQHTLYVHDALIFRVYSDSGVNILSSQPDLEFLDSYARTVTGDGEGRFAFDDLPAGKYVLSATITWHAPQGSRLVEQQVEVVGSAEVREGETARVIVTDKIEPEFLPEWRRRSR